MAEMSHLGPQGALRETFNLFDEDGSGAIDSKELHDAISELGTSENGIDEVSEETVNEIMKHIDHDQNGEIDFQQFQRLVNTRAICAPESKDL